MIDDFLDYPLFDLKGIRHLSDIEKLIDNGDSFGVKFYFFDDIILKKVKSITEAILLKSGFPHYIDLLYNGMKEIIINGLKANLKRVIFKKNDISLDKPKSIEKGMKLFKEFIVTHDSDTIETLLKDNGYVLIIYFFMLENGLKIEVLNNSELTGFEEKRIREKFKRAMQYKSLIEYIEAEGEDQLEGAGLGLFLFVLMLREMGINPANFRVGRFTDGFTVSRIEIPFNENYCGKRDN
jgi:hypothetical protein